MGEWSEVTMRMTFGIGSRRSLPVWFSVCPDCSLMVERLFKDAKGKARALNSESVVGNPDEAGSVGGMGGTGDRGRDDVEGSDA